MSVEWHDIGVRYGDTVPDNNVWLAKLMRLERRKQTNLAIDNWLEWMEKDCDGPHPWQKERLVTWRLAVSRIKAIPALDWLNTRVMNRDIYKAVFLYEHDDCGELMRACLNDRKQPVHKISHKTRSLVRERSIHYFNARSSRKVIVCHHKLAALVDLTSADSLVFCMMNMQIPDLNWQALRCITREDRDRELHVYNIVLRGSRDEDVSAMLRKRAEANTTPLSPFSVQDAQLHMDKADSDTKDAVVHKIMKERGVSKRKAAVMAGRHIDTWFTTTMVRDALTEVSDRLGMKAVIKILNDHGAIKVSELYPRHYKSVIISAKEMMK